MGVKTKSKGSGRVISKEQYDLLYESFIKHRSCRKAAIDAGVETPTAKKYILRGTNLFPCIRDRVEAAESKAMVEQDYQVTLRRRRHLSMVDKIGDKLQKVLDEVEFVPTSGYIMDENGDPIRGADGKPLMAVNEDAMGKILGLIKEMKNLSAEEVRSAPAQSTPAAAVQINVQGRAQEVERAVAGGVGMMQGTESERDLLGLVRKEAKSRNIIVDVE